ncbi:TapB family protein [Ekhidna sp.]
MKKLFFFALIFFSIGAYSQCNDSFFPFNEGVSFEQTAYDKKGKEQGKTISSILKVDGSSATVKNVFFDKKDKEVADGDYTIICEGDMIKIDFNNFIPDEMLSQYGDAEVAVEGDFITVPNDLQQGQTLPDGSGVVTIKMSGAAAMNIKMNITITDRTVEKAETLTTSAGSYETFKIIQKTIVKMNIMGMNKTTESSSASWFAKEVGMVKNESYNKKGDLVGYTLLTSFNKN